MSHPHLSSDRALMITQLYGLLRRTGYKGVTMEEIARSTGLAAADLEVQFPGGKPEIAQAVLHFAHTWIGDRIICALRQNAPFQDRLEEMLNAVQELYSGGREPCIVASMMVGAEDPELSETLSLLLIDWLAALRAALVEHGLAAQIAETKAAAIVGRIEGGLMLARALDAPRLFTEALDAVRNEVWL